MIDSKELRSSCDRLKSRMTNHSKRFKNLASPKNNQESSFQNQVLFEAASMCDSFDEEPFKIKVYQKLNDMVTNNKFPNRDDRESSETKIKLELKRYVSRKPKTQANSPVLSP